MSAQKPATPPSGPRGPGGPGPGGPGGHALVMPTAKPKDFKGALRRLGGRLRAERLRIAVVLVLAVISVTFMIMGPKILGNATNILFDGVVSKQIPPGTTKVQAVAGLRAKGQARLADMLSSMKLRPGQGVDFAALARTLLLLVGVYLLSAAFAWLQQYIMAGVAQCTVYRLRQAADEKLARLPLRYFDDHPLGDDDHRGVGSLALERCAQARVGGEVQGREAVVEDVDLRPLGERPCDGQTLPLTAGDAGSALGDGCLELFRHLGDELPALSDLQITPELLVGGVVVAVAQVARHRAAEQKRLLRHETDATPEVLLRHVADVDAVDEDAAAGNVVEPRNETDERGLAAAGAADDSRHLARTGREADAAEHRVFGARIAELDVLELDAAASGNVGGGRRRVDDRRVRLQHLLDALRRRRRARHHDEHDGRHEHGHQDLHDVREEGGEVADGHAVVGDLDAPEPHDGDRGEVEDGRQRRHHQREQPVDPERGVGEVQVSGVEALLLVADAGEGADHAHAAEHLARDLVDAIDLLLHRHEERDGAAQYETDEDGHDGDGDDDHGRERHVEAQRHDDAADGHDGRRDHDVEHHEHHHLHLLHVVGGAGDQRRRAEVVDLGLREALDAAEQGSTHVAAEGHGDLGAPIHRHDGGRHEDQRDEQHEAARLQDVGRVAGQHAVVDDVGVERRQIEVGDGLYQQEHEHDEDLAPVRLQTLAKEADHSTAVAREMLAARSWRRRASSRRSPSGSVPMVSLT